MSLLLLLFLGFVAAQDVIKLQTVGNGTSKVTSEFLGYNHNMLHHYNWTDDLADVGCKLKLPIIRYPGGTISAFWRWQQGWVVTEEDYKEQFPNSSWAYMYGSDVSKYNGTGMYTLENLQNNYIQYCKENYAFTPKVNFVLNMITRNMTDQVSMLQHAASIGIPVQLVELGNEYYAEKTNEFVYRFPTAQSYATEANVWAARIRTLFPNASISVIGREYRKGDYGRAGNWTQQILQSIDKEIIDSVTMHPYWGAGVPPTPTSTKSFYGNLTQQQQEFDNLNNMTGVSQAIASGVGKQLLSVANYTTHASYFNGMNVRITESNVFDRIGILRYTWVHALQVVGAHIVSAQTPIVKESLHHSFDGCCGFATTFTPPVDQYFDGRLIAPLPSNITITPNLQSGPGLMLNALSNLFGNFSTTDTVKTWPIQFSPSPPTLAVMSSNFSVPSLVGVYLKGDEAQGMALANLYYNSITIDSSTLLHCDTHWVKYVLPSNISLSTPLTQENMVDVVSTLVHDGTSISLDAHSVHFVTCKSNPTL
eukprot:m.346168 g.346168  ORF g.346168 m.346168 type:complete len:536 (+) comp28258_c0_seq1:110-1717(+)